MVGNHEQLSIYNHQLQPVLCRTFAAPVSCLCANEQMNCLYVCLYDSPFYTLNVLNAQSLQTVRAVSLTQYMDLDLLKNYFKHTLIDEDRVFTPDHAPLTEQVAQVTAPFDS